ncbi:sensor histidine kinase [Bacteroides oleiciplenus]|uniref:sensor histidine kinase n=1 Tax=Bacteroides oleiciplenus TaxID=626931 RepID=UPI0026DD7CDE|nr:ATP-binding protein [Bacteroides oleiciplenus]
MFKSIEYKLITYLLVLMVALMAATLLFVREEIIYGVVCAAIVIFSLFRLFKNYRKFNKNILFLLNAMENGDYSFHFSTTRMSLREKELNRMLNRIKGILVKARREIIENEEFLGTIVESVSTGIIITDEDGFVRNANRSAMELLGLSSISHLNQLRNVDESFPSLFLNLKPGEAPLVKIANEREETELSLHLTKIVISGTSFRIITLNNIGSELEAKEMESWIRLIRVMTHEIMNSIAPITSLSESLLFSFRSHSAEVSGNSLYLNTVDALETINATTKGLLNFVESYRQFTRIPQPQIALIDTRLLLEKVVGLCSAKIEEQGGTVQIIQKGDMPPLYADESQVLQVLVNLVKNAAEAFGSGEGEAYSEKSIELAVIASSRQTVIEVRNNGAPIPQEILPHIFVPFFTTKESGSGIGLSLSRYIMRLHGGNLKHYTAGGWTIFGMVFCKVSPVQV